jgi:hypothetical protein
MYTERSKMAAASGGHLRRQRADQEIRRPDVGGEQPVEGCLYGAPQVDRFWPGGMSLPAVAMIGATWI